MPKNIKSWLDGLNFNLNNYEESKNFKEFNDVNDIILLIDERWQLGIKIKLRFVYCYLINILLEMKTILLSL